MSGGCRLCGLDTGRSNARLVIDGTEHSFCCSGCMYVYQILLSDPDGPPADFTDTDLYRTCVASGIISQNQEDALDQKSPEKSTGSEVLSPADVDESLVQELAFKVGGMWCTACSWLIEHVLRNSKGILDAQAFFFSDLVRVRYLPHLVHPQEVLNRVSNLGYSASFVQDHSEERRKRGDLLRLGVSAIFTANVMMISFALDYGFFRELGKQGIAYFAYPLALLATPVIFYGGLPILKRAWSGLRFGTTSMETLIAVGALSAYVYSLIMTAGGSLHLYFDTATMLVTLVLLGKYVETQARGRVSGGINELLLLASGKVRLWQDGRERWISPEAVEPGYEFVVLPGERTSVDGLVLSGWASVDESVLTGESNPVKKSVGDEIMGGTLLLEGRLHLRATHMSAQGSLGQMIALMQEALTRKNRAEILADRITRRLVPGILFLAAATAVFVWLHGIPLNEALLRGVTVLVITCPCALGIATPLAKVASIGLGRTHGILIRDHGALERAKDMDAWIFDKTGTVTEGNFMLREIATTGTPVEETLHRVASVEARSDHFLAREIVRTAREGPEAFIKTEFQLQEISHTAPVTGGVARKRLEKWERIARDNSGALNEINTMVQRTGGTDELKEATSFESHDGLGVKGIVGNLDIVVGNREFMSTQGMRFFGSIEPYASSLESKGATVVFFGWEREVQGLLSFGDSLRKGAKETVSELRSRGCIIQLISGDSQKTTQAIARELGVDDFLGQVLPKDKVERVKILQEQGRRVAMIGDGINDAAALAQADVGVALGSRVNLVQEASDITLFSSSPGGILDVLSLSLLATRVIRQNLFFAFLYNVIGIPLAVFGLLNPLVAVFAMFLSSITVIGNTLRISRGRIGSGDRKQKAGDRR